MSDVFISYSRKDKDFVEALHSALKNCDRTTWVDWSNIPLTADWWQEIQSGIEAADTFLFVISPDSVVSTVCNQEIEHAVLHHKRLFPIVRRDGFDLNDVHAALQKHNWLFFRETDDFNQAFHQLLEAIDTDLEHVRRHTRLLIRAIEWEKSGRDESFLLRGNGLADVEQWIAQSRDKEPRSTPLQTEFIIASEEWQRQEIERLQTLYEQAEQRQIQAEKNEVKALCKSSEALFISNQEFEALLEALRAVRRLKTATWQEDDLQEQIRVALQQAVYGVTERNRLEMLHPAHVRRVCFSPDGNSIASAIDERVDQEWQGHIVLWSLKGQRLKTFKGHQNTVLSVCFSPDGTLIASASWDKTIKLWNLDGQELETFEGHTAGVYDVTFSPDGLMLASASHDGTVKLWNLNGQELKTLPVGEYVHSVKISPDGKLIAAGGRDKPSDDGGGSIIKLWSIDGQELQTLIKHIAPVTAVCFTPNSQYFASSGWDRKIKIWSLAGEELLSLDADHMGNQGNCESVADLSFSPDGTVIAAATNDGFVKLWGIDGQEIMALRGHTSSIRSISFNSARDGLPLKLHKTLIASGSNDGSIRIWSLQNRERQSLLSDEGDGFLGVAVSPDGQRIVGTSHEGIIRIWNHQGEKLARFRGHNNCINAISFSPDGQTFATCSNRSEITIKLWNLEGQELQGFVGHEGGVYGVSFSPDGEQLISAGWEDCTMKVWNLNGTLLQSILGPSHAAKFSPDGTIIASDIPGGEIKLWNRDGQELRTLNGHSESVYRLCFSPDGQILASASYDKTVKLWSLEGQEILTLRGHRSAVNTVCFSPDGSTIATASYDKTVKLWNLQGQELKTLRGHSNSVTDVCFNSSKRKVSSELSEALIASASMDGTIKLWNAEILNFDQLIERGCNWVNDYLQTNPNVEESDRQLCNDLL
jgi:WD40 repeat protein